MRREYVEISPGIIGDRDKSVFSPAKDLSSGYTSEKDRLTPDPGSRRNPGSEGAGIVQGCRGPFELSGTVQGGGGAKRLLLSRGGGAPLDRDPGSAPAGGGDFIPAGAYLP
jgi:hypothetical protein